MSEEKENKDNDNPPLWSCGEKDSFANATMKVRLPKMVRNTIASNQDRYSETILQNLETLANKMETNQLIDPPQPQNDSFDKYWTTVYNTFFANKTWQNVPFYPIEAYLFRIILQIIEYNNPKSKYYKIDPFERSKLRELIRIDIYKQLSESLIYIHNLNNESLSNKLYFALTCCMWSNKMDLNFKPGVSEKLSEISSNDSNLLHDDRNKIVNFFMKQKDICFDNKTYVSVVCDNSGAEILNDLLLCDTLLKYKFTEKISLHCKLYPTYVSDVTVGDIDTHLSYLYVQSLNDIFDEKHRNALSDLYQRLTNYLKTNRLILKDDHLWNSAECFDKIANDYFNNDYIVIFKGDANYRRLVLAKMWNPCVGFDGIIGSYFKTNLVTLRTMKSDCAIGIDKDVVNKVEAEDVHWRHNGKRGVIQCYLI